MTKYANVLHDNSYTIKFLTRLLPIGHTEIKDPVSVGHSLLRPARAVLGHESADKDLQARFHRQRERERIQLFTFARCRGSESIVSS